MRHLGPLISICLLSLASCNSSRSGVQARSGCDLDALAKLAGALESTPEGERVTLVWPGVVDACGSAMPEELKSYFDSAHDPNSRGHVQFAPISDALAAMKRKACPNSEQGAHAMDHHGCNFARYEVFADDEIATHVTATLTWATHQWFLDQGLAPEHARVITRSLYTLDLRGDSPIHGLADLRWPVARGIPIDEGFPVVLTQTQISFNERRIVGLADGALADGDVRNHLIPALYDPLEEAVGSFRLEGEQRGETWDASLLIVADARTPFATIVDVMFTAGRAEVSRFGFVVASEGHSYSYLPISLPRYPASPTRRTHDDLAEPDVVEPTPVMTVELHTDGLSLSRVPGSEQQPQSHPRGANHEVSAYAEALRRDNPAAHEVVISADGDVPLQDVIAAITAARGPGCRPGGQGCVLPDLIIMHGSAHRYQHLEVQAIDNDDVWGGLTGIEIGEAYGVVGLGNTGLIGKSNPDTGYGGRGKPVPEVRQAKAKVDGKLDADIVRRIVRAHINEVRSCYNAGLAKNPKLAGRVTIDFVIASTGKVRDAKVAESTLSDASVDACIAKAVKRWTFPKPQGGGEVEASYPFVLSPG